MTVTHHKPWADGRRPGAEDRIARLEARVDSLAERLDALDGGEVAIARHRSRVVTLYALVDERTRLFFQKRSAERNARIDEINRQIADLHDD